MGRRRRKVIRMPKKRLPKFFDCPRCGEPKSIRVQITQAKAIGIVKCGECGEEDIEKLNGNQAIFNCPKCNHEIARVTLDKSGKEVTVECSICHKKSILPMPVQDAPFNCSCEPSKQSRLTIQLDKRIAEVICGACGLVSHFIPRPVDEPVDIYTKFIDKYYSM